MRAFGLGSFVFVLTACGGTVTSERSTNYDEALPSALALEASPSPCADLAACAVASKKIVGGVRTYKLTPGGTYQSQKFVIADETSVTSTVFDGLGATIVVNGSSTGAANNAVFQITSSNVTIKNVTIQVHRAVSRGAIAVDGRASLPAQENVTLLNVKIVDDSSLGNKAVVVGPNVDTIDFLNSWFVGTLGAAIDVNQPGVKNLTIDNSHFINVNIGLLTNNKARDLTHVVVRRSEFTGIIDSGLQLNHPVYNLELNDTQRGYLQQIYNVTVRSLSCVGTTPAINGVVLVQVATLTAAEAAKLSFIGSCDPTTGPTNFTIEDNDFTMPALPSSLDLDNGHCIALAGVKDAKIVHNRFHYCIYNAIHIEDQSARIWIRDNTITTVGGYAGHWSKNTASIWAMQSRNIVAFKNDLGSARDCGVHLYQTCGVQLLGNTIPSATAAYTPVCYNAEVETNLVQNAAATATWPADTSVCTVPN